MTSQDKSNMASVSVVPGTFFTHFIRHEPYMLLLQIYPSVKQPYTVLIMTHNMFILSIC